MATITAVNKKSSSSIAGGRLRGEKVKRLIYFLIGIGMLTNILKYKVPTATKEKNIKSMESSKIDKATKTPTAINTSTDPVTTRIVSYMQISDSNHNNRAYFSRLFRDDNFKFRSGMEVGVAAGRFTEHFLKDVKAIEGPKLKWTMVEPFPEKLVPRYNPDENGSGSWKDSGLLDGVDLMFYKKMSLDKEGLLDHIPDASHDFIYLDGDHSYNGVKQELPLFWKKVKSGGILAGHDYCNHGETNLPCNGCENIPKCQPYTEYGTERGKSKSGRAENQNGVVKAVQEWLTEMDDDRLTLYYTNEDFTRESLEKDGMDYDLIITSTRNPSWFFIKP